MQVTIAEGAVISFFNAVNEISAWGKATTPTTTNLQLGRKKLGKGGRGGGGGTSYVHRGVTVTGWGQLILVDSDWESLNPRIQ